MISFSQVRLGSGREFGCSTCARRGNGGVAEPASLEAVREDIVSAVRSWTHGPGPNITFVGFEPFAHPELPSILRVATDLGCRRVMLRTDAGALSMPGNAEGALAAGVRLLEVVLLADGEEHDRLADRPGLFAAASAGVRAFTDAAERASVPMAVCGLVPICRHNAPHAPAAVARLAGLGAVAVHVDAAECPKSEFVHVVAALDTAAANAVAASVEGLDIEVPIPWEQRPWTTVTGGAL